jgi:8-oxo-dGTP diphosphatase
MAEAEDGILLPQVCVVYIVRCSSDGQREVLLGTKGTGIGKGNLVAPGGKLEQGETAREAAAREVEEEVGLSLSPDDLALVGKLTYLFPYRPAWSQFSWVFVAQDPGGGVRASEELDPSWIAVSEIPFGRMWADARYWIPDVLSGGYVRATFEFGPDGRAIQASNHPQFSPSSE